MTNFDFPNFINNIKPEIIANSTNITNAIPGGVDITVIVGGGGGSPLPNATIPGQGHTPIDIPTTIPDKVPVPSGGNNSTVPSGGNNSTVPSGGNNSTVPSGGNNSTVPSAEDIFSNGNDSFAITVKSGNSNIITNNVNGDPLKTNEKVVSTIDKMNYTNKIINETLITEKISENTDKDIKKFLDDVQNSKYFKAANNAGSTAGEIEATLDSITIAKGTLSAMKDEVKALDKYADDVKKAKDLLKSNRILENPGLLEERYTHLKTFLENDNKWGAPQKTSTLNKFNLARAVNEFAKKNNKSILPGMANTTFTIVKGIKFLAIGTDLFKFSAAVYNQISEPGTKNLDNVWHKGIDVLVDVMPIPVPFVDILLKDGFKNLYNLSANAIRKNLEKSDVLNPFDLDRTIYIPKFDDGKETDVLDPFDIPTGKDLGAVRPSTNNKVQLKVEAKLLPFGSDIDGEVEIEVSADSNKLIGTQKTDHIINNEKDGIFIQGNENPKNEGSPDFIENYNSERVTMTATGAMINFLSNNASIVAGSDPNLIYNVSSDGVTITTKDSPNTIDNRDGFRNKIKTGKGNDIIYSSGSANTIFSDDGNNVINSMGHLNSIKSGSGDDEIDNIGDSVTVNSGAGDDYISNAAGNKVTINSGDGDDTICNDENSSNVSIIAGSGADYIENLAGGGTIDGGADSDTIVNFADKVLIFGNSGDDQIVNISTDTTINAGTGDDTLINSGENITINAEAGNDAVDNTANITSIDAGAGSDSIENSGNTVTINGGADNDTIYNGHIVTTNVIPIDGIQETVYSSGGTNVTINGGEGADFIQNKVYDWDETTESYKIATENVSVRINGENGNDAISNYNKGVTINGGAGADSISNTGDNVSINGGSGDDIIRNEETKNSSLKVVKYPDKVTIVGGVGNDRIYNNGRNVLIYGNDGDDYINNGYPMDELGKGSTIYGGAGNDTIVNYADNVLIDAGLGVNYISSWSSKEITINAGEGNDTVNITGEKLSINSGAGNDYIYISSSENFTINAGVGDDTIIIGCAGKNSNGGTSYYNLANNATINAGAGDNVITNNGCENITLIFAEATKSTINGANETTTIILGNGNDTYSTTKLDNGDLKVTSNDKELLIVGAANLSNLKIIGENPVWSFKKNSAIFGTKNETLVTVTGVQSTDGLHLKGNTVTVDKNSLRKSKLKISSGYVLKLNNDVDSPKISTDWTVSKTSATLKEYSTAGYAIFSDGRTIDYKKATKGTNLATITGLQKNLQVKDGEINGINVNQDTKVITLSAAVLSNGTAKISGKGNYTLEFADDVATPTEGNIDLSVSNSKLSLKSEKTAGYVLATNKKSASYQKSSFKTLAQVSGLNKNVKSVNGSVSGFNVNTDTKVITLSDEILSNSALKVTGDYIIEFADDVKQTSENNIGVSFSGTKLFVKSESSAYYVLAKNGKSAQYKKATSGKTLATVSGFKKGSNSESVTISDNAISISGENLSNKVSVGGEYEFHFDNYNKASITGSKADDFIAFSGSQLTITGGKGNDYILNEGENHSNTFAYSNGDGDDIIANFTENDKIKTKGTVKSVETKGVDAVIKIGSGSITLKNFAGQAVNINSKIYETADPEILTASKDYWFLENNFDNAMVFDTTPNTNENFLGQIETNTNFYTLGADKPIITVTEDNK